MTLTEQTHPLFPLFSLCGHARTTAQCEYALASTSPTRDGGAGFGSDRVIGAGTGLGERFLALVLLASTKCGGIRGPRRGDMVEDFFRAWGQLGGA
jgi:hypothetical protein